MHGCSLQDILSAVGLTEKDLFNDIQQKSQIEAEYVYRDENNNPLYKVMRFYPKSFTQAKYVNGEWVFKMHDVRYVLYNLQNVINSDVIYFVEGEKDADNLNKIGLVATTTVGGASGFNKHKEEYIKILANKKIVIIPDNDEAGIKYAKNIYESLKESNNQVMILDLKAEIPDLRNKEDISDVLERFGVERTLEIINKLSNDNSLFEFSGETLTKELLEQILNKLNIKVAYNEITKNIDIIGLPKEYSQENAETTLPIIIKELLKKYKIKATKHEIEDLLILIFDSHRYNPIIDMLNNCKWDKIDRFNILFEILGVNDEFYKKLIRKWFYQTVSIVFNGYNNYNFGIEEVFVLQGNQGCGKTRFFRNIALNPEWFTEGANIDMKNKDSLILGSKGWIVELRRSGKYFKKETRRFKSVFIKYCG